MGLRVKPQPAHFDVRTGAAGAAAGERVHAGDQLVQIKRFDQIIVSAGVQPGHAMGHRIARAENQHRRIVLASAQLLQHRQSVLTRQAQIEQHQIKGMAGQRGIRGKAILDPIHGPIFAPQTARNRSADHRVVFHQQDAHRVLLNPQIIPGQSHCSSAYPGKKALCLGHLRAGYMTCFGKH